MIVADHFIVASLLSGYPVVVESLDHDIESLMNDLSGIGLSVEAFEENGLLKFVDAYSKNIQMESTNKSAQVIDSAGNVSLFLKTMDSICSSFVSRFGQYRMVFFSLTG